MTICTTKDHQPHEDSRSWMGGEAAVGEQAEQYVRSQEKHTRGLAAIILGLAFVGGFALAGSLCRLCRPAD